MSEKIIKTLRFDLHLIRQAEQAAKEDNRSFNNWLETLMMYELRNNPRWQHLFTEEMEKDPHNPEYRGR
jgi:hypothetical protein